MERITISPSDVILATVTGLIAATAIIPFSLLALIVFAIGMWAKTRSWIRKRHSRSAITSSIAAALTFGGILAGAALYRPAKIVDQQLARKINLPSTELTLAELSYAATYERDSFPIRVSLCFADDDRDNVIKWPRNELTLGEFLDAIESQTLLRRDLCTVETATLYLEGATAVSGSMYATQNWPSHHFQGTDLMSMPTLRIGIVG